MRPNLSFYTSYHVENITKLQQFQEETLTSKGKPYPRKMKTRWNNSTFQRLPKRLKPIVVDAIAPFRSLRGSTFRLV